MMKKIKMEFVLGLREVLKLKIIRGIILVLNYKMIYVIILDIFFLIKLSLKFYSKKIIIMIIN